MAISIVDDDWIRGDQPLRNSDIALKDSPVGRLVGLSRRLLERRSISDFIILKQQIMSIGSIPEDPPRNAPPLTRRYGVALSPAARNTY